MQHRYLVLGLLLEHPMTGYALHRRMQTLVEAVTSTSYGTLYPLLHKLLAAGDVEVEILPGRGRAPKKQYRITAAGETDLRQWLAAPLPSDSQIDFLLRVYLAQHLATHELHALVAQRRLMLRKQIDQLNTTPTTTSGESLLQRYLVSAYQTELAWLQHLEVPHKQTG
jgi:DNA-binding PadR family transcriptional regulator